MKKTVNYLFILCVSLPIFSAAQSLSTTKLRCEYQENPIGIDIKVPRLSWQLVAKNKNTIQTGYHIKVAKKKEDVEQGINLVWDTKKITANESVHVAYQGEALVARQRYYWQVKVWDNQGNESDWSEPNLD